MSKIIIFLISLIGILPCLSSTEDTVRKYMAFVCGDPNIDISKVCHPHPDIWMIPGKKEPKTIAIAQKLKVTSKTTNIYMAIIENNLTFMEIKEGKIDPAYTLDPIYTMHKNLVLEFLYRSLLQDNKAIARLVTDPKNIDFGGAPEIQDGNIDTYYGILEILPVIRSSSAESDSKTKSITYRIPIGEKGFELTLTKKGSTWKIDSNKKITLPTEYFVE